MFKIFFYITNNNIKYTDLRVFARLNTTNRVTQNTQVANGRTIKLKY